jgi:maltose alpha-D-glucosyltransferase/alpha-amylase
MFGQESMLEDDPLWYKDAVIYQVHIRSFFDSNDDGIGDLRGLISRLDYLERLGITAIWLLPFYPSPLRDDGYDIADYLRVNRSYGTLKDFKLFLEEAHRRGIRVITELVLNHTSSEHPWFQRSHRAEKGSKWRDMYVWSDTAEKYADARIIFQDYERSNWAWDPEARAYYWHRFYSHQPDLNFDNPHVRQEMFRVIDHWLGMGVDGLRLDAVPYLFEREGTNCENLPETHQFLKELRAYVDAKFPNRMLLAEANQWPEDAAAYFGNGDECHTAFHFPVMPRLFMAIHQEDSFPVTDILKETPAIPAACQWLMFLRNHDELTMEMVTDEERDYMHRVYAREPATRINMGIRRRLAPLLGNNRRKIELMNILLFCLPGTPVVYYGDELGMGDNFYLGDRNGVRTPMQWSPDRNAGFSRANPQRLFLPAIIDPEYHYESINVENQEKNLSSMLWWTRRVIGMRRALKSMGRGGFEILTSDNPRILAFIRSYGEEAVLVVANLSRFSQAVRLDLAHHAGCLPVETFSRNKFPLVGQEPYTVTLGPHNHYWLRLEKRREHVAVSRGADLPELAATESWQEVLAGRIRSRLEGRILPAYIASARWYGAKSRTLKGLRIMEEIELESGDRSRAFALLILTASYTEGGDETYLLPLAHHRGTSPDRLREKTPQAVIARLRVGNDDGILFDAMYDQEFQKLLFDLISERKRVRGTSGMLLGRPGKQLKRLSAEGYQPQTPRVLSGEQSNTSIQYDRELVLKLYRHPHEGLNPDYEITRFLTEKARFRNIPPYAGALEYETREGDPFTVAMLQGYVENEGDAWTYSSGVATAYFERILARKKELTEFPVRTPSPLDIDVREIPQVILDLIGGLYLELVRIIGQRTAELHLALGAEEEDPAFAPEKFSLLYQKSLYQSLRSRLRRTMQTLRKELPGLPPAVQETARAVLDNESGIASRMHRIVTNKISAARARIHGDYHLGQLLYRGKDFVIMDFEGEPARAISERRLKHSPLKDVAGMMRSFHYAASSSLLKRIQVGSEESAWLTGWVEPWYGYVSAAFLHAYLEALADSKLIPHDGREIGLLLEMFLIEKAVYELGYELDHRPDWTIIPLRGLDYIVKSLS